MFGGLRSSLSEGNDNYAPRSCDSAKISYNNNRCIPNSINIIFEGFVPSSYINNNLYSNYEGLGNISNKNSLSNKIIFCPII